MNIVNYLQLSLVVDVTAVKIKQIKCMLADSKMNKDWLSYTPINAKKNNACFASIYL